MNRFHTWASLAALSLALGASAQAVPQTLNYQGRLTDNGAPPAPLTATVAMQFALYDQSLGGAPLWQEPAGSATIPVAVTGGIFSVTLGANGVPVPASLFAGGGDRWLQITAGGEVLAPRQKLAAAGFARQADAAADSGRLAGVAAANWQRALLAANCPPGQYYAAIAADGGTACGAPPANNLAPPVVLSATLANPVLRAENLGGGGAVAAASYGASGTALSAAEAGASGYGYGVNASSATYVGVRGSRGSSTTSPNTLGAGVWGDSQGGPGVYGASRDNAGVWAHSLNDTGLVAVSDTTVGLRGLSNDATNNTLAYGISGAVTSTTTTAAGVEGETPSHASGATGVLGQVLAPDAGALSAGVKGTNVSSDNNALAVYGAAAGGFGVYGTGARAGVSGYATGAGFGVAATQLTGDALYAYTESGRAVYGYAAATGAAGVFEKPAGTYGDAFAVRHSGGGDAVNGYALGGGRAGYFSGGSGVFVGGNLNVTGTLSKGGGSFKIDHPLDPENKYLYHSFVESPDMKNLYDGIVVTDASGEATVTLPAWFSALNGDFRYQLTVIGEFAQVVVAREIADNRFTVRSSRPGVKISWQVTGTRRDAFAAAHRIPVEEEKPAGERGRYLHPEAFGRPPEEGVEFARPEKSPPRRAADVAPPAPARPLANGER